MIWAAVVIVVVGPALLSQLKTSPLIAPDGFMYVRMMLADRGMSQDEAYAEASRYFLSHAPGRDPGNSALFGAHPPHFFVTQYALFRARTFYPWLGSLLYPRFGIESLWIVSAISVTLAAAVIYVILQFAAPPWLAAVGTIGAMGYPLVRITATAAATDGPALLAWVICLAAMMTYARRPGAAWLVLAVLGAALLAAIRPAIWLAPGAAAGLIVYAFRNRDAAIRSAAMRLLIAQLVVAVAALGYTAAQHGAGFMELLNWQYAWHTERHGHWIQYGIGGWYALFALRGFVIEPIWLAAAGTPVLAIAAAAIGLWRRRDDPAVAVLLGVAAVAPLAILANPPDFARALELPLLPVVMYGVVALFADGVRAGRTDRQPAM